ncbi:MAG: hypothetical protein QOJ90_1171 [Actinomycetota bacterium]|jgi:murein DD-endopeptidase MepM/ murein hydrolase activator NlpD|nr:hypothetical protein [Actinomycetota bacterium]
MSDDNDVDLTRVGTMRRARWAVAAGVTAVLLATSLPAAADDTAAPSSSATPSPVASAPAVTIEPTVTTGPTVTARPTVKPATRTTAGATARPATPSRRTATAAPTRPPTDDPHDAPALVAALAALTKTEADLVTARAAVVLAHADLVAAQDEHVRATEDLAAVQLAEQVAARAQVTVRESIAVHRRTLGQLARSAYQANGPLGEWSVVLSSQTPEQLVDRLAMVQSVTNAGNAMIGHLREESADLRTYSGRLRAARMQQEFLTAAAAAALQRSMLADAAAQAAEQQLEAVLVVHKAALAAALAAEAADRVRYQVFSAQSGQLAIRIRSLAAALAATKHPARGTGSFDRPGTGPVTSPFGPRLHPILHYVKIHTGEDFGKGDGIVYAADDGVVLLTELNTAYGNMTVVDHGTIGGLRVTTLYAHQAAFGVRPGDRVRKGQPIGVIGATGYATGPHLHFEVRIDGSPLDPAPFLVRAPLPPGARL